MKLVRQDNLAYLQFPALADMEGTFHGVFLRYCFNGSHQKRRFNLGLAAGDGDSQVWENRRRVQAVFEAGTLLFAHQVHGSDVCAWSGPQAARARLADQAPYCQGDALVTDLPAQALVIQVADCQPVLLLDPVRRVVANVHSGWRSSAQNILGRTVTRMQSFFGCRPQDLFCGIGPSLGPCCAEFINYRSELPPALWPYRGAHDLFDFWQISVDQLVAAGVRRGHISVSGICTKCNPHLFFTYRGEGRTGRFAAVIGIAPHASLRR
jgi:YfiH family protein